MKWYRLQAEHTAVFVRAIEEHALWAQYNGWQDRKISFYWHTAWQHLFWPQFTDVLLKLLVTCSVSALVWLALGAEAKWSMSEKSPVWWMNEWMMHLYSAFIVYCHTPKALYNHVGGSLLNHHQCAASTWMMRRQPQDNGASALTTHQLQVERRER